MLGRASIARKKKRRMDMKIKMRKTNEENQNQQTKGMIERKIGDTTICDYIEK